jgi:iron complex transport system ATP-binding protein
MNQSLMDGGAATGAEKWISLEDVSFVRSQRLILDRIFWDIQRGNHWVVLGANGSGKTTLLQLLAGYLWPTRGNITVLGEEFGRTDIRELRKKIGWVGSFLEAQIPSSMSPLDLIVSGKYASIGIFENPKEEDYHHGLDLARQLKCSEILDLPYGVLSQGEKQRLLIARGLIHKPQLLVLDEPCAGLDLVAREQLLDTLEHLGRSAGGPTMIFVTHHLQEIMPTFTHAFLLRQGSCLAMGQKREILRSELLSQAFGIQVQVTEEGKRYWSRIKVKS